MLAYRRQSWAFSKAACIDVDILPPCFPKPMTLPPSFTINPVMCDTILPNLQYHTLNPLAHKLKSEYSKIPPLHFHQPIKTEKFKQCLVDRFATIVFINRGKLPAMSGPLAHIHLKEGSVPKPDITSFQYHTTTRSMYDKSLGKCQKRHHYSNTN